MDNYSICGACLKWSNREEKTLGGPQGFRRNDNNTLVTHGDFNEVIRMEEKVVYGPVHYNNSGLKDCMDDIGLLDIKSMRAPFKYLIMWQTHVHYMAIVQEA